MAKLFADSSFYIALFFPRDSRHSQARRLIRDFERRNVHFVTSEGVLVEVLAFFSRFDAQTKSQIALFVAGLLADPTIEVVPMTGDVLMNAIDLYRRRADQPYSLTDCATMEICRREGITDILTADTDFERESFTILLKP